MNGAFRRNELVPSAMLPADVVLGPAWWYHHEGITFDEDFFFHPVRRVEDERKMERALYRRWGRFGLGENHQRDLPAVGAVHLAAGYLISEMLGCRVEYRQDAPPQVIAAGRDSLEVSADAAFDSAAFKRFVRLLGALRTKHGRVEGDVNWSGVLNIALDLRGQSLFMDMIDRPEEVSRCFAAVAEVLERFTQAVARATGTTSISVNRNVRHIRRPVFLHSECSHTMISVADYRRFLMPLDAAWS